MRVLLVLPLLLLQILYSVFTGVEVHDPHARHQYDHHHLCMRVTMAMFARAPYTSAQELRGPTLSRHQAVTRPLRQGSGFPGRFWCKEALNS